jgi:hypothetical protein
MLSSDRPRDVRAGPPPIPDRYNPGERFNDQDPNRVDRGCTPTGSTLTEVVDIDPW